MKLSFLLASLLIISLTSCTRYIVITNSSITDSYIVSRLTREIHLDKTLKTSTVDIVSVSGRVYISGSVENQLQAEKIVFYAKAIPAVKEIHLLNLMIRSANTTYTNSILIPQP